MPNDWTREEVEATVSDYFDMLAKELRGEPFNKAEHNRHLHQMLTNRSRGSIERKHQNISAVLIEYGYPWHYVIRSPSMFGQQFGQRKIIAELYEIYHEEATHSHLDVFPYRYREQIEEIMQHFKGDEQRTQITRVVVDVIADMTEHHAYETYRVLTGLSASSALDFAQR
jgi:dGTP triphosphohydrolase